VPPSFARISALSLCVVFLAAGCNGLTPQQRAGFAGVRNRLTAGAGRLAAKITYAIARYEANARQREIAERNARRAFARQHADLRGRNVRYIAVRTTRTMQSTGSTSCMLWDTQTQQLVGNSVYDCKSAPAPGSTAQFDSYSAEYVGS
jgi:hypothetical protein